MQYGALVMVIVGVLVGTAFRNSRAESTTITIPDQGWTLSFDSPSLEHFSGDAKGKDFVFNAADEGGFSLSIYVEEPKNAKTGHEACFDYYWPLAKRNPLIDAKSATIEKSDHFVKVSYNVTVSDGGEKTTVRNVNYYFAFQGRWVDVHVSRYLSGDDDAKLFDTFERSLTYKIAEAKEPGE